MQRILKADPRNQVITAHTHFDYWVDLNTLVFDVTDLSVNATRMDVFRSFLQYAETVKTRHFTKVILSAQGKEKFTLDGGYFHQLGEREFLSQLLRHKKLIVEFSYYEKAPRTVMFELSGLAEKMKSETLEDPTPQINAIRRSESAPQAKLVATQAAEQKQLEQQRDVEEKRLAALRQKCSAFVDGSPEKIQKKLIPLPPKECREILSWMRDGYLDALYDLQK